MSDERAAEVQRASTDRPESAPAASAEQATPTRADQPSASDAASDNAVVTDDGAWAWKGLQLTPEDNGIADQAIETCRAAEGRDAGGEYPQDGLTPQMRGLEQELAYGELVADIEKYAVKGENRFKAKLAKKISLEPDKPTAQLAAEIHDGIRYTFTFPTDKYTSGGYAAEGKLRGRGYKLRQRKPSWETASTRS